MCFAKYKPKESHVASRAPTSLVRPGVIMKLSIRNSQVEKVGISWGEETRMFHFKRIPIYHLLTNRFVIAPMINN
jgi:hypothetical protein